MDGQDMLPKQARYQLRYTPWMGPVCSQTVQLPACYQNSLLLNNFHTAGGVRPQQYAIIHDLFPICKP